MASESMKKALARCRPKTRVISAVLPPSGLTAMRM
jgi:hypothetical protein